MIFIDCPPPPHHSHHSHICTPPSELIHPNFQVCEDQPREDQPQSTGAAAEALDHPNFKAAEVTGLTLMDFVGDLTH